MLNIGKNSNFNEVLVIYLMKLRDKGWWEI